MKIKNLFILFFLIIFNSNCNNISLCSLRGYFTSATMIGEGIYQALKKNFELTYFSSRETRRENSSAFSQSIFADVLWYADNQFYKNCPKAKINIAYSMFESFLERLIEKKLLLKGLYIKKISSSFI